MARSYAGRSGRTIAAWGPPAGRRKGAGLAAVLLAVFCAPSVPADAEASAATDPAGLLAELRADLFPAGTPPPAAVRTEARVEIAGRPVGSVTTVATLSPVAFRETLDLSGVREVATLRDGKAWYEDTNGQVRRAGTDEMATYRLAHALLFHTYLDAPPPGFSLEIDGDALVFRPEGEGALRTLELARTDDGLLLPVRWRQRQQGTEVVTTFEDWRPADGMRFPYRSAQSSGDPRFDLVLVTTSLDFPDSLAADEIPFPAPAPAARDAAVTDPGLARRIPLRRVGALAIVTATVQGEAGVELLLDTGAGATVLSERLVRRLALDVSGVVEARGAGGSEAAGFVRVDSLALPGVVLRDQTLVSLPLEALRAALERPVDGILGYDFFSRFVVRIDYANDELALFAPGTWEPPAGAHALPLHLTANVPRVEGVLDGEHRGSFVIDLGNAVPLVLHRSFAERLGYLARADDRTFPLSGIGGTERMRPIRVERLALGDATFEGIDAVIPVDGDGALSLDDAAGNVGAGLFPGRAVVLDYGAESLWVLPATTRSASPR